MSEALFKLGGLRFWNEQEILRREMFIDNAAFYVRALKNTIITLIQVGLFKINIYVPKRKHKIRRENDC